MFENLIIDVESNSNNKYWYCMSFGHVWYVDSFDDTLTSYFKRKYLYFCMIQIVNIYTFVNYHMTWI